MDVKLAEETGMREDLEAAIEETGTEIEGEVGIEDGILPPDQEKALHLQDETDPEKKPEPKKEPEKKIEGDDKEKKLEGADKEKKGDQLEDPTKKKEPEKVAATPDTQKAPAGWTPEAREQWSKVPKEIQGQILERERAINQVLQESTQARQVAGKFANLSHSYSSVMVREGTKNPLVAVENLFETVRQLQEGNPQQKAVRMAQMIQHYGIDIEALDNAIVGGQSGNPQQQQQGQQNAHLEGLIDQKMQPVNQFLQGIQQRQHQQVQQTQHEANNAVQEFKGEFLQDLRMDMADLLDMASQRGVEMSLQEAYDKAALLHPQIQSVITKRTADEALLNSNKNLQNKRRAASSLTGNSQGGMISNAGESMRDDLENAWENTTDRI